jgi:ABC-type anion transport system duplicated permease subunit
VEAQGQSGVRYIVWGVLGIIAILITVKQLGFTPTKISTGTVSVELTGGIAPPATQKPDTPKPETSQLENRVHELESQLAERALPASSQQQERPQRESAPNISGTWRADPLSITITQNGPSVVMQVSSFGILASAGYGMIRGHNLQISYTNNLGIPGRMEATISPDAERMDVTDYGRGYAEPVIWYRNR